MNISRLPPYGRRHPGPAIGLLHFRQRPGMRRRKRRSHQPPKGTNSENNDVEIPGFSNAFKRKSTCLSRTLWFVISLATTGLCLYQSAERIELYIEEPFSTTTNFVTNETVEFPDVSLCADIDFVKRNVFPKFMKNMFRVNSTFSTDDLLKSGKITVFDIWDATKKLCLSKVKAYVNTQRSGTDFEYTTFYSAYGICHLLSPKHPLRYDVSQLTVKIVIDHFEIESYSPPSKLMLHTKGDVDIGKYYVRHDKNFFPVFWLSEYMLDVKQQIKPNSRSRPCASNKDVRQCMMACLKNNVYSTKISVLCRLPFMNEFDELSLCKTEKGIIQTILTLDNVTGIINNDNCQCPQTCTANLYKIQQSYDESTEIREVYDYKWYSVLVIRIYNNKILVTQEELCYNSLQLCCDLGGTLGFWLGICGLQILEIASWIGFKPFSVLRKRRAVKIGVTVRARQHVDNTKLLATDKEDDSICSSLPGFQKMVNSQSPVGIRILWSIISMAALCFSTYQCVERIFFYLSDPSTTQTTFVSMKSVTYPSIVICPENDNTFLPVVNPFFWRKKFNTKVNFTKMLEMLDKGNLTVDDLWNVSKLDTKNIVLQSQALKFQLNEKRIPEILTMVGTCHVSKKVKLSTIPITTYHALTWNANKELSHYRMMLYDNDDQQMLKYLPKLTGYKVTPTMGMHIGLRFTEMRNRNSHQNPCRDNDYVNQCLSECIEAQSIKKSLTHCRLPYMQNSLTVPLCNTAKDMTRIIAATLDSLQLPNLANCGCPRRCHEIIYSISYLFLFQTGGNGRSSSVKLFVVEDYSQVYEEEAAYSLIALLSDLGSALGLLLGFSVLSFTELIVNTLSKLAASFKTRFTAESKNTISSNRARIRNHNNKISHMYPRAGCDSKSSCCVALFFCSTIKKTSPLWVKTTWIVIYFVCTLACAYQCIDRIVYFWEDPSLIINYYSRNDTLDYPMLMICPDRYFDQDVNYYYYFRAKPDNITVQGLYNLSRFEIKHSNVYLHKTPLKTVSISEVATQFGLCISVRPERPIPYQGKSHWLNGDITVHYDTYYPERFVNAMYSSDDLLRVKYIPNEVMYNYDQVKFGEGGFALTMQVVEVLHRNTDQNPCRDGVTVAKCQVQCIEKQLYSRTKTSCRLPFMEETPLVPPCTNASELAKIFLVERKQELFTESDSRENCPCPRKCRQLRYSYVTKDKFLVQESAVKFLVRIVDNNIYVIQEVAAYTFFKLLSDLGGTLGLYFGLGVIQMLETAETILGKVNSIRQRKKNPRL